MAGRVEPATAAVKLSDNPPRMMLGGGVNTEHGWENFAAVTPDGCDLGSAQTP